ncbi:DNA replication and repair protein RecF [Candidatus Saccharibacteria bacterium]|nr:DNA replication and repair protein RecF [Candidatus Saccharibacteria bacterium]
MIQKLQLRQFRNYTHLELEFTHLLTIITGPNAIGKTNILESIYVSMLTKSFRVTDSKLIQQNTDFFTIDIENDTDTIHLRLTSTQNSYKKQLKINTVPTVFKNYIGQNPVTLFEPTDLDLFSGHPINRRTYLDRIISQIDQKYLQNLQAYKKLIVQRNSVLKAAKKTYNPNLQEQLFVYNLQIIQPAEYITQARKVFITNIQKHINTYYMVISNESKKVHIDFLASANNKDELLKLLEDSQQHDIASTRTNVGPHREDFVTTLDSNVLNDRASRGELRSLVLAFKLAELDYIEKSLHKRPTLLLDDVLSELDEDRQNFLLGCLDKQQTFITTTHLPANLTQEYQHITLPL